MSTILFHPIYPGETRRRNATRLAVALSVTFAVPAFAGDPVPVTERGLPQAVHPTYQEKGAPQFSYPTGSTDVGSGGIIPAAPTSTTRPAADAIRCKR